MLAAVGTASAQQSPPGVAPPRPNAPAETRWSPPPPLPSASAPYRPLVPADAPPASSRPATPVAPATTPAPQFAPAAPTQPVLTFQKPPGETDPKAVPQPDPKVAPPIDPRPVQQSDPKLDPPANKGLTDPKLDRDPPPALKGADGQINKDELYRMDAESTLLRRITDELLANEVDRLRKSPPERPEDRVPPNADFFAPPKVDSLVGASVKYQPKTLAYPGGQAVLEPSYVVHRRLYFEDLNSERYGWEVGLAQPAISTLLFWKDAILFPAKLASFRGEWYDTSAGKCLPGSPVPYKVYPEPVDAFGLLVGAGTIVGTAAILHW